MESSSKKHHYIPEFYLKNFSNAKNRFHIYLTQEERYKRNGDEFSPSSHFFEPHGNTIFFENDSSDFLEAEGYKNLDNNVAKVFNKLNSGTRLEGKEMGLLIYFVGHLFWRNPMNDAIARAYLHKHGLKALGLVLKNKAGEKIIDKEFEEKLMTNDSMFRMVKYILPIAFFTKTLECNSQLEILDFIPGQIPSLTSDNPLILRNPSKLDVYRDDFILPISRDKILIRSKTIKRQYQNRDKVYMDLLLVQQSRTFVTTTDLNYIPALKNMDKPFTDESLREEVFKSFTD